MSNNRTSRRGIGVARSDYDYVSDGLRSIGCDFTETRATVNRYDEEFEFVGRRKVIRLTFETTSFVFDTKGTYLGRVYMSRDECDYFKPSTKGATPK
jgi:hypothetical protein